MNALVFLTVRTFVNGIRRALTSGRRMIGLIFFALYYLMIVMRPFEKSPEMPIDRLPMQLNMPRLDALDAIVFTVFSFLSFVLVLNLMGFKGGFRKADVDVLFPTPVSPKVVLLFRVVRDYLFTLLMPLLFAVIGWRAVNPGVAMLIRNFPKTGPYAFKAMTIAWFLMALCWVSIGYAASLFVNRSDLDSDRNRKLLGFGIGVVSFAVVTYIGLAVRQAISAPDGVGWEVARSLALSPLLRIVFFTATAATALVMAPITGNVVQGVAGGLGLVGIVAVSVRLAMSQVGWLYDQAAARGFDAVEMRAMRQRGDIYGLMAEQARHGRVKQGWLAARLSRIRLKGAAALLWKDLVLQARGTYWQAVVLTLVTLFIVGMPIYATKEADRSAAVGLLFLMQGLALFTISMTANAGVVEMLQRVDVVKPLPFTPSKIVFWEIASKATLPIGMSWLASLMVLVLRPGIAVEVLAAVIATPTLALLLVSVIFLVTVLFPDIDDPTQRGFRSMMMLFGLALLSLPSGALFALLFLFHVHPLIIIIPYMIVNLAITAGSCAISGQLYASYNPSE